MYNTILVTREDRVVTVTLNRPERLNAVNGEMISELLNAIDAIKRDEDAGVVVLTGTGRGFCAGADVSGGELSVPSPLSHWDYLRNRVHRLTLELWRLEKPVIAAVNGVAAAYGLTLCLLSDIRIVAESARFTDSAVKLALLADEGGSYLLPRTIGLEQASRLMYTSEIIDAPEALRIGLVGQVVPDDQLMTEARDLAGRIALGPSVTLRLTKRAIRRHMEMSLETTLEDVGWLACINNATDDAREGITAFREKRSPVFTGQ